MIGTLLFQIPGVISQSFFAEGSADSTDLPRIWRRSLIFCYALVLPAMIGLLLGVKPLLGLFGPGYVDNGANLLRLITLSIPFVSFNSIFLMRKRIENKLGWIVGANILVNGVLLVVGLGFLEHLSIDAFGYALLVGHGLLTLVGLSSLIRKRISSN